MKPVVFLVLSFIATATATAAVGGKNIYREWSEVCDPDGETFQPDPADCSMYYDCGDGNEAVQKRCPRDWLFNHEMTQCDTEDRVACGDRFRCFTMNGNTQCRQNRKLQRTNQSIMEI
jgi:hypothetical protein